MGIILTAMFVGSSAFTIYEVGGNYKYLINRPLVDLIDVEFTLLTPQNINAERVKLFLAGRCNGDPTKDARWIPVMVDRGVVEDQSYFHYHVTCVDGENKTHTFLVCPNSRPPSYEQITDIITKDKAAKGNRLARKFFEAAPSGRAGATSWR